MTNVPVDIVDIPMAIGEEEVALLASIYSANAEYALAIAGALAEGFVRGLEIVEAIPPEEVEKMYRRFQAAVNERLAQLAI